MAAIASCSAYSASSSMDHQITPGAPSEVLMVSEKAEQHAMLSYVFNAIGLTLTQIEMAMEAMNEYKEKTTCHAISKASGKVCGKHLKDGKCPTHKENVFPKAKAPEPAKCPVETGKMEDGSPKVCNKKCVAGGYMCTNHSNVRETPDGGCDYVFQKAKDEAKKGTQCGKKCVDGSHLCKAHKTSADKALAKSSASSSSSSSEAKPVKEKPAKKAKKVEEEVVIEEEKLLLFPRVANKYYLIKGSNLCVDNSKTTVVGYFTRTEKGLTEEEYGVKLEWHSHIPAYLKKFGALYNLKTNLANPADKEEAEDEEPEEAEEVFEANEHDDDN